MAAAAAVAGKLEEAWDEGGSLTSSSQLSSSSSCSAETLWSRHGSLVLIASVQALAMADQQIIPVNMTAVAAELGFSNAERDERLGGDVAIAFFATGAVTSFIAGRLADVLPRVPLIAGLAVVGGCASLANSRIAIFEQLVACRALAGIALGGILPTMYSAVGDLYAPEQRPQVAAFITVMAGAGPLLGQTLAGFLGPAFGWRVPFAILGVMAVALGMLVFWLVAEPPRGEKDRAEDGVTSPAPGMGSLRHLLSTPTVLLVFGQAITGCVPWAVILTFLTDFLAVDGELGVERATLTTLFFSVGCFFGVVVGGHAGKDLYARDPRALPALMAAHPRKPASARARGARMFDIDNLDTFIDRGKEKTQADLSAPPASKSPVPAGAASVLRPTAEEAAPTSPPAADASVPKSREERLRDFYAKRQQPRAEDAALAPQAEEPPQGADEEALRIKKRGNELYQSGDYEAAVEFYTTAIKTAPSSVLHSNRAAAYMMLGWWDQALRDTKVALRKDPQNEKALERQGKVQLAMDNLDAALYVAEQLEAKVPEEERQKKLPQSVRRLRWLAHHARDPKTLEECRAVLAEFSAKGELVSPLGMRLRKRLSKALVDRSDAIDNQRKIRPAIAKNRATEEDGDEIQEITPFAEEAIKVTGELLEDNPDDPELRYLRGRALLRLGRHGDAEAQFKRGLMETPDHEQMKELSETMNSLEDIKAKGNAFYKEGKLNEAIQYYTLGIDKDPACVDTRTVATLHYNRSAAWRKKGEFEKALEDVDTSLALHPKWAKALYRRGILLLEVGRCAEALTELKVVQRSDPTFDDDLEVWLRRAHNWMSKPKGEVNYYKFMRVPMDASKEDVKKQYRRLCLLWHPDKNGGQEGRQRFEELQEAYKFLMDDEQREKYDFGIWKDKAVRHHVKTRQKVKDSYDDTIREEDNRMQRDKHVEEDEKVESIYWGDRGVPQWVQDRRKQVHRQKYGYDSDPDEA